MPTERPLHGAPVGGIFWGGPKPFGPPCIHRGDSWLISMIREFPYERGGRGITGGI